MGSALSSFWADPKQAQHRQEDREDVAGPSGGHVLEGAGNVQMNGGYINAAGRDIHTTINNFHGPHDSDLVSKIQDWLAPHVNYRSIQIDTFNKRAPDTGTWLLESEKFKQWLDSTHGVLWGVGIPGAGKTILASIVIDHLRKLVMKATKSKISVAFAYCRYTDAFPVKVILAALIRQLLEDHPELVHLIEPMYCEHQRYKTEPTQRELIDILIHISSTFDTIFFVLDGLDEAPQDDQFNLITILASVKVHFIITSRPLKQLERVLPDVVFFEVVARKEDIRVHVTQRIAQMPEVAQLLDRHGAREEVISTICEKAEGMFLHAILQVEMLRSCLTMKKIREALNGLPTNNEDMYMATLDRIRTQSSERASLALRILVWLVFAQSSLSVEDLQWAVSMCLETHTFDPEDIVDEELLVSVCCGLVTIDAESRFVRLIHFTAKDALQSALLDDFPDPQGFLASTCVSRLISCQFHESEVKTWRQLHEALEVNPFLEYAYDTWHFHAKQCIPSSPDSQFVSAFLQSCLSFPIEFSFRYNKLDHANGLHLAAYYGFVEFIDIILDCDGQTPALKWIPSMVAMVHRGQHLSTGSDMMLCSRRIQVNTASGHGSTALILAAVAGHENVVEHLLQFNDLGINLGDEDGKTALMWASEEGHVGVVNTLLRHSGVEVNLGDREGCTALMQASEQGHVGVVKELLNYPGVDVNQEHPTGCTALMFASAKSLRLLETHLWSSPRREPDRIGKLKVVQALLGYSGIQIDARDDEGCTALDLALEGGYRNIVQCIQIHQRLLTSPS